MSLVQSLSIGAPEIILSVGAFALLLAGVFAGNRSYVALSWATVALFVITGFSLLGSSSETLFAWNRLYVADAFSTYLKAIILIAAAVSVLMAMSWLKHAKSVFFEYPVLIILAVIGMFVMVSASNLLSLYIGLELLSLSSYVLAAGQRDNARSSEAGLKYFVLGSLASGMLLYGVSLVYGFVGSTDFHTIGTVLASDSRNLGGLLGIVFVLAGLAFKISAVPFHMWIPDVYEGAPTPVTAFFGSAPKVAAMGLLIRVAFDAFGGAVADWRQIIILMSIASMILGAVGAIGQENLKRLLAYSAINNVGFMLIGVAAATPEGVAAVLLYLAIYVVMSLGAFLCLQAVISTTGEQLEDISSLAGLARSRPWLAAGFGILMFSLAGIPPLFGFVAKLMVFKAAVEANLWVLAVLGVVTSVVGAFYYLRVVKVMFLDQPTGEVDEGNTQFVDGTLIVATAIFCSPLGYLLLGPLLWASRLAAFSLF